MAVKVRLGCKVDLQVFTKICMVAVEVDCVYWCEESVSCTCQVKGVSK